MFEAIIAAAEKHKTEYHKGFPLSLLTSFKTGGPAALYVLPADKTALADILSACRTEKVRFCIVGNGSNPLISDDGFPGLVIRIGPAFSNVEYLGDGVISCDAGESVTGLCNFALKYALTGLEFAFGIPGTAGGAAYMNAGAYGGEMKDVLQSCEHIAPDGTFGSFSGEQLALGYRKSVYTDSDYVITKLILQLQPGDPAAIRAAMDDKMARRKAKQALEYPSAGSTFKRPVGYFAGALIEECGLKGFTVGGAQVSEKHAGFEINKGGATTADILNVIHAVQERVYAQKGVRLETEVKYIG